ncbi:MAG: TetR/AcrR family transcriptional regulator [Acidobacteria bacterium]|nr:TetR/AcrR family transcriptional regulator [Acidobacteriota bacterium]
MTEKRDTAIRQEQIATAALSLIAHHGLQGLSVAGVARRVGLVPSALYRHYGSKDDIVDAALDLVRDRLMENVRAVGVEQAGALNRLHVLLQRHVALLTSNQAAVLRVVFSEEAFAGRASRRSKIYRIIRGYLDGVAAIVSQGQVAGEIRADLDPQTAAVMFLGLIQPAAILWFMSGGALDVSAHAEAAWTVLSRALRP